MKKTGPVIKNLFVKSTLFFLILAGAMACNSRTDRTIVKVNTMLDSLQAEYAPDTRIALWDLDVSGEDRLVSLSGEVADRAAYKAIVQAMNQNFPEVSSTVVLLPGNGKGQFVNGLVNNSVANIRAEPSSRTELITQVLLGTPVRLLKEEEGWYLVQTPNGYIGWVNDSEVHALDQNELVSFRDADKIIFTEQYGVSYSRPDENSLPVSDLVIGCLMSVVSGDSKFYQIQYPDGRLAWVIKDEVVEAGEVFNNTLTEEGLVETVLDFNGIPYLWGGASSKAIDCSGLTSNAFFMNGTLLPRDADQQSHIGSVLTTAYEYQDLMTGDLLFFGRKATDDRPESVSHVAIYLGDSEFIHAAGYKDRVSINSMDSTRENYIPTYPDIFVRAVRIIGEESEGFESIRDNEFYKEIIINRE